MIKTEIFFKVCKLKWERIFLLFEIQTNCKTETQFYLERIGKITRESQEEKSVPQAEVLERIPVQYEKKEENKYHFFLNIAAMDDSAFLNNGRWRIVAHTEYEDYICVTSHKLGYTLDDFYGKGKYAYNISFSSLEDEKNFWFLMNSYFMIQNKHWKTRRYVQEAMTLKGKFKRLNMYTAIVLMRAFYVVWSHIFPKRGKNILLMSETKDYLWGNLKSIDERLHARGLDKQFHVSYSFRRAVGSHMSILSWAGLIFKIAKQDYIFVDDYVPVFGFLKLCKKTKLIQVWHAGVGFKSVGYSRFGKSGTPFPAGSCHKQYD